MGNMGPIKCHFDQCKITPGERKSSSLHRLLEALITKKKKRRRKKSSPL